MPIFRYSNNKNVLLIAFLLLIQCAYSIQAQQILPGANQTSLYFPLIKDKKIGIVANHTSLLGSVHLADTLISRGYNLKKVFAPEHGFRGITDAGKEVSDSIDIATGIPIMSLYGAKKKPTASDLKGIEVMIYDIQDVGVRFFTFISTLHLIMEACAENNIPLIVLDRPNPLGFYTDGPVLDLQYKSFVGMHPIPVVYGMTTGELALMINGEKWLKNKISCKLTVIPCKNYNHNSRYQLPVRPSPNLNSMEAIYLYPSLCFFEGTIMSVGRGTEFPFRVIGSPEFPIKGFSFIPVSSPSNKNPPYNNIRCYGIDLRKITADQLKKQCNIQLEWIMEVYQNMPEKKGFFNSYFNSLAGNQQLMEQIVKQMPLNEIRASWQKDLNLFRAKRKKYLIYSDYDANSTGCD